VLERKAFQLLFDSRDQKEGAQAFLEKRKAIFSGE
jgi:enoyl-CoA hydratase/carnithine racemase